MSIQNSICGKYCIWNSISSQFYLFFSYHFINFNKIVAVNIHFLNILNTFNSLKNIITKIICNLRSLVENVENFGRTLAGKNVS